MAFVAVFDEDGADFGFEELGLGGCYISSGCEGGACDEDCED